MTANIAALPADEAGHRRPVVVAAACGVAIFLSAFLMFLVEPMIGLGVLPVFGGVPATWATVLCFFQAVLVLGYLYGHLSITRLTPRQGAALHALVASAVLGATAVAPASQQNWNLLGADGTLLQSVYASTPIP